MPVKKKYKKNHRDIKLPAYPPRKIPYLVRELVNALNQQKTGVRAFAKSERISFSKVYNWISGKAQPKRDSTEAIMRYFKKIRYKFQPEPQDHGRVKAVEENPAVYHAGKIPVADKLQGGRSFSATIRDIQIALKIQAEQTEYIRFNLHRIAEKMKTTSGDVKALQDLLVERFAGDDAGLAEKMHSSLESASMKYATVSGT